MTDINIMRLPGKMNWVIKKDPEIRTGENKAQS